VQKPRENSRLDRAGSKQETSSISFPRRTGQRGENGGENENGFLDRICRIGAERRKTAAGSPKGERSELICSRIR
jgi:hypothetical protein